MLIVDDEKLVLSSLRRILKRNHEVLVATSYEEAEQVLERESVDELVRSWKE